MWALRIACCTVALGGLTACACGFGGDRIIVITYTNNTGSLVCHYYGTAELLYLEPGLECHTDVPAMKSTSVRTDCSFGFEDSGVAILLVEQATGRPIYENAASCREWMDAGSTVTIDRGDGGFVVTDGFQEQTPIPAPN